MKGGIGGIALSEDERELFVATQYENVVKIFKSVPSSEWVAVQE